MWGVEGAFAEEITVCLELLFHPVVPPAFYTHTEQLTRCVKMLRFRTAPPPSLRQLCELPFPFNATPGLISKQSALGGRFQFYFWMERIGRCLAVALRCGQVGRRLHKHGVEKHCKYWSQATKAQMVRKGARAAAFSCFSNPIAS